MFVWAGGWVGGWAETSDCVVMCCLFSGVSSVLVVVLGCCTVVGFLFDGGVVVYG